MDAKSLFEILIRENSGSLLAFLRSALPNSSSVEDLFQETMLVAWRRLDDYDKRRPFGPWLRGIASRLILAHFRNSARQELQLDEPALEWLNERLVAIEKLAGDEFSEKLAALRECVQVLPVHYRQPIELRYKAGLALPELAANLQLSLESLKKRLLRAKNQLFECVQRKLAMAESKQ